MSVEAVKACLGIRTDELTTAERFVLLALAEHASDDGTGRLTAWPSASTLAAETGLSRPHVQACLKRLRDHGLISQTGNKRRRVHVYMVRLRAIKAWHHGIQVSDEQTINCQPQRHSSVIVADIEPEGEPEREPDNLPSPPVTATSLGLEFTRFWSLYPRKVGKLAAEKAYAKARRTATEADMAAALHGYVAATRGREQRFIVHPATWLNQGRWMDEGEEPQQGGTMYGDTNAQHWRSGGGFTTTKEGPTP